MLPCQHTYCRVCIKQHSDTSGDGGTFKCPIGRETIDVPEENDFTKFPVNRHCMNLIGMIASILENQSKPLCREKFHEGKSLECLPLCREKSHMGKPLEYFCKTCDIWVCKACTLEEPHHKDHEIFKMEEESTALKHKLLENKSKLKQKQADIQNALLELEEAEKQLSVFSGNAEKEMEREAEKLQALIDEQKIALKRKIRQEEWTRWQALLEEKRKYNAALKEVGDLSEYTDNLTDDMETLDKCTMDMQQVTSSLLDRCEDVLTERATEQVNPKFWFVPRESVRNAIKLGLGDITAAAMSDPTIEGPFRVKLAIDSNAPEKIRCKVLPENNVIFFTTFAKPDGLIVEFTTDEPGEFTVEARINGKHITNSPTKVTVQLQEMAIVGEFQIGTTGGIQITPYSITVNSDNTRVAITDSATSSVYILDMEGALKAVMTRIGNEGWTNPTSVAFMKNSTEIAVADDDNTVIHVVNYECQVHVWSREFPLRKNSEVDVINITLHVSSSGDLIACGCARAQQSLIVVYDSDGDVKKTLMIVGDWPACCITHNDMWIISDIKNHCIHVFDVKCLDTGLWSITIGSQGSEDSEFDYPHGLAIDSDGNLLVCDQRNHRIQKFSLDDGAFLGKTYEHIEYPSSIVALSDGRVIVTESSRAGRVLFIK